MKRLLRSTTGAGAAEFALVLPVLLMLLFGIIDGGRLLWETNRAEKATQVGARMAIVTESLSPGLRDADYAGSTSGGTVIEAGANIPIGALGTIVCDSKECRCEAQPCPSMGTYNSAAFTALVTRMQKIYPQLTAANVQVRYSGSGLGSAGDLISTSGGGGGSGGGSTATEQMEVAPLITVSLTGIEFRPITSLLMATLNLPDFATTLTAEDVSGSYSE